MQNLNLSQALAREAQEKDRAAEGAKWYTTGIRSMVMDGFRRTYEPVDDDGEPLAPEEKLVQDNWYHVMQQLIGYHAPYIDAVATKDFGNLMATADLEIGPSTVR
jgi:hypothetical protein